MSDRGNKLRAQRKAMHAENVGKVACCHRCHKWFPSTAARNEHRLTNCTGKVERTR